MFIQMMLCVNPVVFPIDTPIPYTSGIDFRLKLLVPKSFLLYNRLVSGTKNFTNLGKEEEVRVSGICSTSTVKMLGGYSNRKYHEVQFDQINQCEWKSFSAHERIKL